MEPRTTAKAAEPLALALERTGRFHRDTGVGRIFHPGKVSFRELTPTDSLHIVIDGRRLMAHVDRISPVERRRDGSIGYSWTRVVAHNVSGVRGEVSRLFRRHPNRRASLDLEVVWADEDAPDDDDSSGRLADRYLSELNALMEQTGAAGLAC